MPTYEYRCRTCGAKFEYFQSMSEAPLKHCLEKVCQSTTGVKGQGDVERMISSGAGLVFKGSGFYITDYKKAGSSPSSEGAARSDSAEKSEASDKSEKSDRSDKSERSDKPDTSTPPPVAAPVPPSTPST
jgi:putative FmdB family regulatory protein